MINNLLNKLPFPVKLMLIGIVPLLFLIYMAVEINHSQVQKIQVLEKFIVRVQQSANISSLIDALQAERRYAFGFALNKSDETTLMIKRNATNLAMADLEAKADERLLNFKSYTFLEKLPSFRKRMDDAQEETDAVMSFYSNIIFRLNSMASISTEGMPYLEPLTKDINGQRLLSEMITYLGILRAGYYSDLYTNQPPAASAEKLADDYTIFISYEKEFLIKGSASALNKYKQIRNSTDLRPTIITIEKVIKSKRYSPDYNAEAWWDVSANAIAELKKVQRQLLKSVQAGSEVIYDNEKASKNRNLTFLLLIIALVIIIVIYTTKNISEALAELKYVAQKIAVGVLGNTLPVYSNDAIGSLTKSILLIDANKVELARTANEIGKGHFDVKVVVRSKDDVLGNAVQRMKTDLEQFALANEEKLWIQDGLNAINDSILGEKELSELCRDALKVFADITGGQVGLFYIANDEVLQYAAGYAVADETTIKKNISFGSTQTGQAASNKRIVQLENVSDDYLKIASSSGDIHPRHVLILPLLHNHQVEGVIEMASINPFSPPAIQLMEIAMPNIAIALQSSKSREKLQELLEETQAQTEELQAQHSELENLNEELEVQAQKLQASEEELRVQQEELQQTNNELNEQTGMLEEKNKEVNRKAEELVITTRYKSEFLANMSHELRTPLNSILLLSRLLSDNTEKNLSEGQIEYAQVILNSGNGLLSLIDEILDLSKIEAGKMHFEYGNITLKDIAEDLHSLFKPVALQKKIDFSVTVDKDAPAFIETDKLRMEQILKNLISNAFKFTHNGSVKTEVKMHPADNSMICITVTDTGIGIAREKQALIFEAFQQADGSTRRKYGGTGLGLSISRELAKLLGGEILLSSEVDKGSVFTLNLPIKKPVQDEEYYVTETDVMPEEAAIEASLRAFGTNNSKYLVPHIPVGIADDRETITPGDKCILIIEDDTRFAKSLLDYTREQGYKGIVSVRGDEGLELARQFKPRGILLDIQLPVKSGWEVMDELKKDPETRLIPVHIMSSHEVKNESLSKGAVNFINKPMAYEQMPEIFKKIEDILSAKSSKVLIVEENNIHSKALSYFLESFKINSIVKSNIAECLEALQTKEVDCVILDMGISDRNAYEMLEEAKKTPGLENLPIIVFTGKNLSLAEEQRIKQYADSIIVKTAYSYQRILDEISLFLHVVNDSKPAVSKGNDYKKMSSLSQVLTDKTVLVVDDDVRNIFSLTKTLENLKMKVLTAIDGNEALLILRENPQVDLVLLDMMMPQMDGYETADRIRKNVQWKNLPVIAVTAKAMTGDREKCIRAGASDYITKPVDTDQLLSLMRVWLYERA